MSWHQLDFRKVRLRTPACKPMFEPSSDLKSVTYSRFRPPSPPILREESKSPRIGGFRGLAEFASAVYSSENRCKLKSSNFAP
jgi:hypothetical protein